MSISLTFGATTLALPEDLYWADEAWAHVEQTALRSVTGALIVSTMSRVAGRPITLRPEDDRSALLPRSTLETLMSWANVPGREMVLNLRGVDYDVIFRHHDGSAIEAVPFVHYNDVAATDLYVATLKFTVI